MPARSWAARSCTSAAASRCRRTSTASIPPCASRAGADVARILLLGLLVLGAKAALATPRIESISVRPNPVPFTTGKVGDVVIAVSIERPTPLDLRCEAAVDPGDGGPEIHLAWNIGDSRTKTARYEYSKSGTYRVKV